MRKQPAYILGAGLCLVGLTLSNRAAAQDFIPAEAAFESPACSDKDLRDEGGITEGGQERLNPEWKPIFIDPNRPITLRPWRMCPQRRGR